MLLNKNITLRPAAPSDWPAIEALLLANKLPLDGAQAHLDTYLLAVSNGEIVGSAGAEVYGHIALLRSVAVAPGLHKQGIGKLLLDRLIHEAQRRDIARLYLLTVTAPEYFAQYGFKRGKIDEAPHALKASAEFQGACPACAAFMTLTLQVTPRKNEALPVAVLGAGPVGLAAAARLLERNIPFVVLEAGNQVGTNLLDYGHVRLFSPWQYNVDPAMAKRLELNGWHGGPPIPNVSPNQSRSSQPSESGLRIRTIGRNGSVFALRFPTARCGAALRCRVSWRSPDDGEHAKLCGPVLRAHGPLVAARWRGAARDSSRSPAQARYRWRGARSHPRDELHGGGRGDRALHRGDARREGHSREPHRARPARGRRTRARRCGDTRAGARRAPARLARHDFAGSSRA